MEGGGGWMDRIGRTMRSMISWSLDQAPVREVEVLV